MLGHHRHASETQFNDGPLIGVFGYYLPSSTKKYFFNKTSKLDPHKTNLSLPAHALTEERKITGSGIAKEFEIYKYLHFEKGAKYVK